MVAIFTKYKGPTNCRGSRMIATSSNGHRLSVSYGQQHNSAAEHDNAARLLAEKMGWHGTWHSGGDRGNKGGNVYVCALPEPAFVVERKS